MKSTPTLALMLLLQGCTATMNLTLAANLNASSTVCDAACKGIAKTVACDLTCEGIDASICEAGKGLCKFCLGIKKCVKKCEKNLYNKCKKNLVDKCEDKCVKAIVDPCEDGCAKRGLKICEEAVGMASQKGCAELCVAAASYGTYSADHFILRWFLKILF
tara:strand:- start:50 stop:532 length:483 start_codon:yes stop_codon:yes gene_type:complete